MKLKYRLERLRWWKVLFSPLKPFTIKWYVGKLALGTPYFYPRKAVKSKTKPGYLEFKPLIVGFDSCSLGWKTKWTDTDFRFEHGPMLTFVFFGYQIAVTPKPPTDWPNPYWEIWLCYEYATDKTKSKRERIKQCREIMPQKWVSSKNGVETRIDYYEQVVKPKYLK